MKKVFLALMAIAAIALTSCENSKNEPQPSHEAVDLGLSVKWATMNVGATKPEEYGDYFAWGETSSKTIYDWSTYFDTEDGAQTFTKYQNEDGKTALELADDAAHVNWGGSWRMPTIAEIQELKENCTWTWTEDYNDTGIKGYIVTSNAEGNNNSIFLPAAGDYDDSTLRDVGSEGLYWSSSLDEYDSGYATYLGFSSDNVDCGSYSRYYGQSVRPVCK